MNSQHYDCEHLKSLREAKGLTQKQVGEALDIDRQTVFRAESGVSASYELLCALADLYEVEVVSLLYPHPLTASASTAISLSVV
jgi:transcriptional regulator with XRE-family HTH domain